MHAHGWQSDRNESNLLCKGYYSNRSFHVTEKNYCRLHIIILQVLQSGWLYLKDVSYTGLYFKAALDRTVT